MNGSWRREDSESVGEKETRSRFAPARVRKPICTQHKAGTLAAMQPQAAARWRECAAASTFLQFFPGLSAAVVRVSGLLVRANAMRWGFARPTSGIYQKAIGVQRHYGLGRCGILHRTTRYCLFSPRNQRRRRAAPGCDQWGWAPRLGPVSAPSLAALWRAAAPRAPGFRTCSSASTEYVLRMPKQPMPLLSASSPCSCMEAQMSDCYACRLVNKSFVIVFNLIRISSPERHKADFIRIPSQPK
ncbi:hypothetical protein HDV63DRAFT_262789 [Trichoderma sp. SZMC 28014]